MVDAIEKWKDRKRRSRVSECVGPCSEHEELLSRYDDAEYGLTTSVEPIPSNNIRRKKLYRQLTLMLNGGPHAGGQEAVADLLCLGNQRYAPPILMAHVRIDIT
jgi:hypothetical protein